jgi:hypothetical protein
MGLIVPKFSDKKDIMAAYFDHENGPSAQKMHTTISKQFCGIRLDDCVAFVRSLEGRQSSIVRFTNKPPLQPITASRPHIRHQMDLVDMLAVPKKRPADNSAEINQEEEVNDGNEEHRYVISIIDVFSRYACAQFISHFTVAIKSRLYVVAK